MHKSIRQCSDHHIQLCQCGTLYLEETFNEYRSTLLAECKRAESPLLFGARKLFITNIKHTVNKTRSNKEEAAANQLSVIKDEEIVKLFDKIKTEQYGQVAAGSFLFVFGDNTCHYSPQ